MFTFLQKVSLSREVRLLSKVELLPSLNRSDVPSIISVNYLCKAQQVLLPTINHAVFRRSLAQL